MAEDTGAPGTPDTPDTPGASPVPGLALTRADLAAWAVEHNTAYAEALSKDMRPWTDDVVTQMRKDLDLVFGLAVLTGGWSEPDADAWVMVCVCAPDWKTAGPLSSLLCGDAREDEQEAFMRWHAAGPLAAWAYAAGMTPEDTRERWEAGTLDRGGLLLLAGLHGWVFPPLP